MKTQKSLFDIAEDVRLLEESLESVEDDQEMTETILAFLEDSTKELFQKIDNYLYLIQETEAIAKARKEESKRLSDLSKQGESKAKALKNTLKFYLESEGKTKMETPRFKLSIAKNGGKTPIILNELIPPEDLPFQFQRAKITPDLDKIREALENGDDLDFAEFDVVGTHLRIR